MARPALAIVALVTSYAVLGLLMNSVGTVILQSIAHYGVSKPQAATLEACKDLSVVAASFLFAVSSRRVVNTRRPRRTPRMPSSRIRRATWSRPMS